MTSSSYPMCYIIDGTAKVSDPIFFQCNYQFRIAIDFSHHFWNPRLLHRSLFHTDDFSLLLENKRGGGGRHLNPF